MINMRLLFSHLKDQSFIGLSVFECLFMKYWAESMLLLFLTPLKKNCKKKKRKCIGKIQSITSQDTDSMYTHFVSACLAVCHILWCTLRWVGKMRWTHKMRSVDRQDMRFVNGTHYLTEIWNPFMDIPAAEALVRVTAQRSVPVPKMLWLEVFLYTAWWWKWRVCWQQEWQWWQCRHGWWFLPI